MVRGRNVNHRINLLPPHAWPHITPEQQKAREDNSKLSGPRADRGILVGNDLRTGLYIVLIKGRITRRTRCVKIDETPVLNAMQNRVAHTYMLGERQEKEMMMRCNCNVARGE